MKIAIIGCGAMGSVYAALLADSGNDVWAIDTWEEHISAIRSNGLRVEGASGDRTVSMNATTNASDAGECELIIVATKASGVPAAAVAALGARRAVVPAPLRLGARAGTTSIRACADGGTGALRLGARSGA